MNTSAATLDEVISHLSKLDPVALAEVEKRAAFLRASSVGNSDAPMGFTRELVEAMIGALRSLGIPSRVQSRLANRSDWGAFSEKIHSIETYLSKSKLSQVKKRAILDFGVRLLVKQLEAEKRHVSLNVLISEAHRIPTLLQFEFPGYAQAGLLGLIFR